MSDSRSQITPFMQPQMQDTPQRRSERKQLLYPRWHKHLHGHRAGIAEMRRQKKVERINRRAGRA